jgi:hypothetical protein
MKIEPSSNLTHDEQIEPSSKKVRGRKHHLAKRQWSSLTIVHVAQKSVAKLGRVSHRGLGLQSFTADALKQTPSGCGLWRMNLKGVVCDDLIEPVIVCCLI